MTVDAAGAMASGDTLIVVSVIAWPDPTVVLLALAMAFFLGLRAFYAGSETALVSANRAHMRREAATGRRSARIVKELMDWPEGMLAMTLVGTNLMSVIVSQVGLGLTSHIIDSEQAATLAATLLTTTLVLIFGEILPKTIFRARANELALRFAYPLWFSRVVFAIPVHMLTRLTGVLAEMFGRQARPASPQSVRAELHLMATLGEESGGILSDQRQMIHSALDLGNRTLHHVMVPLVEIAAIEKNSDLESLLRLAAESGHSRIPIYDKRIYNIIGFVHVLDVIHSPDEPQSIEALMREKIRFVSEMKHIGTLLREIQESRDTMVFAVDEYGGTVGLVTVEDLVEEIVGEMFDERDAHETISLIGPRIIECDGRAQVDVLIDTYGVRLAESAEYETIAGFLLASTSSIPVPGDVIETGELIITVLDAHPRGIRRVRVESKQQDFARSGARR